MFQLAGCIGFRMNVGNFLELQRPLHAQCIIQPSADVQQAVCGNQLRGNMLGFLFVFQNGTDDIRCLLQQGNQSAALCLINGIYSQRQFKRQ